VWGLLCTAAWGFQGDGKPPAALLLSPVNATWAANNASYWRDKGFRGFILTGIAETVARAAGDSDTAAAESTLTPPIRELRLACERLAESGLTDNFLYWDLSQAESPFSTQAAATSAANAMRVAGALCAAVGLKGVAIDSASSSAFYDYRWDGYGYEDYTPADLDNRARRFGRSLARALLLERPGAEILFITDGFIGGRGPGPLWLPLFEGLIEGCAMDEASRICLLTRESFPARSALDLRRAARGTGAILDHRLQPEQRALWRRKGSVCLGMAPLRFDSVAQKPVAAVDPATFRGLVAAAKALSGKYIWIESAGSCWWRLTQQEVDTYSQLLQNGPAVASQTTPVVDNLDDYTLHMPYDKWQRAGPLPGFAVPAEVYATDSGASLVLWAGSEGDMTLPVGETPLTVRNLASGEQVDYKNESGSVVAPAGDAPLLIDGLPARPWLLEAGLRVEVAEAPRPSNPRAKIACRFQNSSTVTIRGAIDFLTPPAFSVNPANLPFQLEAGEAVEATVNVRGKFAFGKAATITVSLTVAGGGIITRALELETCPDTAWQYALDGDAAGNVVAVDVDGTSPTEVVVCTDAGEIVCIDAQGGQVWKRRFSTAFAARPAAGLLASGAAGIAVVDTRGILRLLNAVGEVSWERAVGQTCLPPFFADVDEFAGQELLLPFSDGRIRALGAGGDEVWSYKPMLGMQSLQPVQSGAGEKSMLAATQNRPAGLLALLGSTGRVQWSAILDDDIIGTAILPEAAKPVIVTATETGAVTAYDAANGEIAARNETQLAGARFIQSGGPGILITSQSGLHACTAELEPVWAYEGKIAALAGSTASVTVVPVEFEAGEIALICIDGQGRQLWRSFSGPSVTGSPLVGDFHVNGTRQIVYSSTDRILRCLTF
jgi:outer membrane protein assembly factor BamB